MGVYEGEKAMEHAFEKLQKAVEMRTACEHPICSVQDSVNQHEMASAGMKDPEAQAKSFRTNLERRLCARGTGRW